MMTAEPTKTWDSKTLAHPRQLLAGKVSPCGQFAFAGDFDGRIQRWLLADDSKTSIEHHSSWIQALVFHPDKKRLFTADFWGQVAGWNYADENPRPLWSVQDAHAGWIRCALATADGQFLATAGNDLKIRLWDVATGKLIREFAGHPSHIYSLAEHPDGSLVSADQEANVKHWDVKSGRLIRSFAVPLLWHSAETTMSNTGIGGVRSMAFSPDGSQLVLGGISGERVGVGFAAGKPLAVVYDWAKGELKRTLKFKELFEGFVTGLIFHPEGFLIGAGGGVGGQLWFWKPDEDEPFHTVKGLRHIRELSLHADNIRLYGVCFEPRGEGGNGRRKMTIEQYVENVGGVRVFSMTQKPAAAPRR